MKSRVPDITQVSSIKTKDEKSFEHLFKEHSTRIYLACYQLLGDEVESEDIMIESFQSLWQEYETIENQDHALNWLYVVARRRCINLLKKADRKNTLYVEESFLPEKATTPFNYERAYAEMITRVGEEMNRLPARMREAFYLRYIDGLPVQEVAKKMGVKGRAVYKLTDLAVKRLNQTLFREWAETSLFSLSGLFAILYYFSTAR